MDPIAALSLRVRLAQLAVGVAKAKSFWWDSSKHERQPKGSDKGGEFAPKGGAAAGGKAKEELQVPTSTKGSLVYDLSDGMEARVQREKDGTFYGMTEKFDFTAANAGALRTKLAGWGARYVGAETRRIDDEDV